jgi:hypothetical protein
MSGSPQRWHTPGVPKPTPDLPARLSQRVSKRIGVWLWFTELTGSRRSGHNDPLWRPTSRLQDLRVCKPCTIMQAGERSTTLIIDDRAPWELLYAKMQASRLAAGTANHVHRTVRAALNLAVERDRLARNPAKRAKAPRPDDEEVEPYEVDEIQ